MEKTPSVHELTELFGRIKHWENLSAAERTAIVRFGRVCTWPAGTVIYREGEAGAGVFVLLHGSVHIVKLGLQGQQTIVAEIKPVVVFNEVTVLDGGLNPATAIAVEHCVVWHVGYDAFQTLLQRYPAFGLGMLRLVAARMRMLLARYEDVVSRPVLARTAKLLLEVSARGTQPILRRHYTNTVLAARIATVPEAFSRALRLLRQSGAITHTRTAITLNNVRMLEELVDGSSHIPLGRKRRAE